MVHRPETFAIVINAHSGSASGVGEEALRTAFQAALGGAARSFAFVRGEGVEPALTAAFDGDADAVIVVGGDGTCRAAATLAAKSGKPVAFLPGGTMNVLPRKHWSNLDLLSCVRALGAGAWRTARMSVGRAGEEVFMIAAAFGAAAGLTRMREEHRAADTIVQRLNVWGRLSRVMPFLMRPTAWLEAEGAPKRGLSALALVLGDADVALGRTIPGGDSATLECVGAVIRGPFGFMSVLARAFLDRNWRSDPRVFTLHLRTARVRGRSRFLAVTLDGEIARLPSPIDVRVEKDRLTVIRHMPAAPAVDTTEPRGPATVARAKAATPA
jgi:diacylglycerol kinase family enzyme